MSQSRVNREAMQQAAVKVDNAVGQIQGVQSQMHGHKGELDAAWKGDSKGTFDRAFEVFDQEFAKVIKDLVDIHEKLGQSRKQYEQTEQEKQDRVNNFNSLLNNG
jgi:WXG100 family type VII secretion target